MGGLYICFHSHSLCSPTFTSKEYSKITISNIHTKREGNKYTCTCSCLLCYLNAIIFSPSLSPSLSLSAIKVCLYYYTASTKAKNGADPWAYRCDILNDHTKGQEQLVE